MTPEFPKADFYECCDVLETYSHTDPVDAIADYCGSGWEDDIKDGLTVYCYRYQTVPKTLGKQIAQDVLERISDETIELQDPDGGAFTTVGVAALMPVLEATIQAIADNMSVWACEEFAQIELTEQQVRDLLKEDT